MTDSTGQSPADHEGTYLEPDERDDEVLTMTRRDLRILVNGILKNHVRLDTVVRVSGNFVTDEFVAGDRLEVSGSSKNAGKYMIDTVSPGQFIGTTCGKCGDLSHEGKECYSAERVTRPRDLFKENRTND